jgi:hypothetical protein
LELSGTDIFTLAKMKWSICHNFPPSSILFYSIKGIISINI